MEEGKTVLGARLSFTLLVMTISVPVLYLIGYGYYEGYLDAFGISSDFFPKSIDGYLVLAFLAFTNGLINILSLIQERYLILITFAICMTVLGFFLVWLGGEKQQLAIKRQKEAIKSYPRKLYFIVPAFLGLFSLVIPFMLPAIIATVVAVPYVAVSSGNYEGKADIKNFQECVLGEVPHLHSCAYVYKNDEIQAKGLLVARSTDHVAIYQGGETIILPTAKLKVIIVPRDTGKVN